MKNTGMWWNLAAGAAFLVSVCGCPAPSASLKATITASTTSGAAPLLVVFTAGMSTSPNGAITDYAWDFGGDGTASGGDVQHTFTHPGLFPVMLTITDNIGAQASAEVDIRVPGAPPTAKIAASTLSGDAPLTVKFDGTGSSAPDDTIHDYYWDFGDQGTSRESKPTHVYQGAGTFTVTLRVVTGGGSEASTTATVKASLGSNGASLQFNGFQKATLPVAGSAALTAFTLELWAAPDAADGALVTFGSPTTQLQYLNSSSTLRLRAGTANIDAATANLSGGWHFLAATYDGTTATLYVDGNPLGSGTLTGLSVTVNSVILGDTFHGKLSSVRLWSTARTAAEVTADLHAAPSGSASGLVGSWPIDEGVGQFLGNDVAGNNAGVLGDTSSVEASDPAWSNDAP